MSLEHTTSCIRICQTMAEDVVAYIQRAGKASKNEIIIQMANLKNPRFADVEHVCKAVDISLERGLEWGILKKSDELFEIADENLIPKDTKASISSMYI